MNFIGDGILDLINLGPPTQSQSQALINTGSGNAGGALSFLGLPYLAMATDNGNGVILIDTAIPATPASFLTAPSANLKSASAPDFELHRLAVSTLIAPVVFMSLGKH